MTLLSSKLERFLALDKRQGQKLEEVEPTQSDHLREFTLRIPEVPGFRVRVTPANEKRTLLRLQAYHPQRLPRDWRVGQRVLRRILGAD